MGKGRSKRGSSAPKSGRGNSSGDSTRDGFERDQSTNKGAEKEEEKVADVSQNSPVAKQGSEGDPKIEKFDDMSLNSRHEQLSGHENEGNSWDEAVLDSNGTNTEVSNHEREEGQVEDIDLGSSIPNSENEGGTNENEKYSCDHCGYKTRIRAELVSHMSYDHENKRKNSLLDLKGKKLLKTSHHEGVRLVTSAATATSPTKRLPFNRFKIEYTCDLCSEFRARNLIQVLSHRAGHLVANNQKKICHSTFSNNIIGNHSNGRKTPAGSIEYDCSWCDFKASNLIRVLGHIDSCHPAANRPAIYTCDVCPFKTPRLITLMSHRSVSHFAQPDRDRRVARPAQLVADKSLLHCDMCKFRTDEREKLDRHLARHTGEKLHSCHKCNYKTLRSERFQVHVRTKHGDDTDASQD